MDISKVEKEARAELQAERAERAKGRLKGKLQEIDRAEQIVANLRREYEVLLEEVAAGA